jgi:hypothetical protein
MSLADRQSRSVPVVETSAKALSRLLSCIIFSAIGAAFVTHAAGEEGLHPSREAEPFEWRLAGTIVGPAAHEALFARAGEICWATQGDDIDGWQVSDVSAEGATLIKAGRTLSILIGGLTKVEQAEAARQQELTTSPTTRRVQAVLKRQEQATVDGIKFLREATRRRFTVSTGMDSTGGSLSDAKP